MENKDAQKYKDFDSSSDTSSVGSDESLEQASGPNFADFARQLTYEKPEENTYYSPFDQEKKEVKEGTYPFPTTFTEKKDPPKSTDLTTLFLIDSLNRDRVAFPQPTNLTLKLPRTYKNVKSISLTQVKLLCSFYYFSDKTAKSNIYLPIRERGREEISTFYNGKLTKVLTIREGTYGINDLLNEIQTQMNFTPLFYDFPGGFTDFIKIFTVSGDFGINFNQPGDTYYDSLNNKHIQNPTFATIVSYYWGSRYAGLPSYTMDQFKVAYYYPVLYEVFLDETDTIAYPDVKATKVPESILGKDESVYSHLIFNMSGINDKVALYLINQNITLLDKYRDNHTFRTNLVNRYQLAYDSNSLQVNITTSALNTSLVNLINNTSSAALTSILTNLGLTPQSYATLQNTVNKATVVYTGMFQYLQEKLTTLVGISFATYSPVYFNNIENIIYFQNGLNATGVRQGYTLEYLTSGEIPLVSTVTTLTNSPVYWPRMIAANGYKSNLTNINSPNSIIPYNIPGKNFQFGTTLINSTDHFFNTNKASRSVDALVNIYPGQYTIFKFRSSARQTLQVETLPLPYYYRYADYNKTGQYKGVLDLNKNNVPKTYFDISYNFVYNESNKTMDWDASKYKPNFLLSVFGQDFTTSFIEGSTLTANSQTNYIEFEFTAPYPPGKTSGLYATNTSISFVSMASVAGNLSTLFPDSFTAFVYHDRAAFMADLSFPRKENPLHFINAASTNSTKSDITINFSTFSGHKYYTIFRSDNLACSNTFYRPLVCTRNLSTFIKTDYIDFDPLADPTTASNLNKYPFVTNYNPDFTRLPTNSNITGFDPTNSTFNMVLPIKEVAIGYDISGVSNDLTDYIGYVSGEDGTDPTTQFRVDPLSFYTFQKLSQFDAIAGTYFNSSSLNSILEPVTNNTYSHKGAITSEVKIVHWYDGFSIPKQLDDLFTTFNTIGISNTSSMSEYLKSYPVNSDKDIVLGRGINAIGFLPNDGLFEVSSFSFKSCIYPLSASESTSEDPNLQIEYVGVFSGLSLVNNIITLSSALTVLKFKNSVAYGPNTLYRTPGFGTELGTWYTYNKDPDFVPITTFKISGYTPNSNELLSYNSMYYMVPFNSKGANLTYSALSGSLLAYPKAYTVSLSNIFYGQTTENTPGTNSQTEYIIPLKNNAVDASYGPQGIYSPTQSQYAGSIPITTTSLGYKEYSYLANDINTPFSFSTFTTTTQNSITTFVSEYSDNMYIVNSPSLACSNSLMSYPSAAYASSLSTIIKQGSTDCMKYLATPHPVIQNYDISGSILTFSTFTFEKQDGANSDITTRSIELNQNMSSIKLWLWGGGGGTLPSTDNVFGGAGAHVNVNLNVETLLSQGISTLYIVVGKGGNRDNEDIIETIGSLQLYEERRYGGGGTSLLGNFDNKNSISLQGGGFSGIFSGSNINTSIPLLIVGGGGAAGATTLGGPGGFGITEIPLDITNYSFNTATFNGTFYNPIQIIRVRDVFNNSIINMGPVQNTIDRNLNTIWDVVFPSKMNPNNYIPTANTYGLTLQYSRIPTQIQKIRYYGPPIENKVNLPTGFILYNDQNKSQILYSNTGIKKTDFQTIYNGSFEQQIYEFNLTRQVIPQTISKNAWITVGLNTSPETSIQYSLDRLTWVPTQNSTLSNITSIQYVSIFSKWIASSSTILQSIDGITWTSCQVTGFTGTLFNSIAYGNNTLIAGGNDGSLFISTDGNNWTYTGTKFTISVTRIRFINDAFWAIGDTLKRSVDGMVWTNIDRLLKINDIAYGVGRYVIAQDKNEAFNSGIIYSEDGTTFTWTTPSQLNIISFTGISIVYANNLFVAVGKTTDNSSFIKYSIDGINWSNSKFSTNGDIERTDIQHLGNIFVSMGKSKQGTGLAGNQVSIITSTDAINWSYSLSGGFDPDLDSSVQGKSVAYGPITIIPDLSRLYMEIQSVSDKPYIYEIRSYDTSLKIPANTSSLIDNNMDTVFYPPEEYTVDVIEYPLVFTFVNSLADLNKLTIYAPSTSIFTGITVSLANNSVIYTDSNITSFSQDTDNNIYEILFVPQLKDISQLNLTFIKNTPGSIQISNIKASYDPNMIVEEKYIETASDLDNRQASNGISNIYDKDNSKYWAPDKFIPGDLLRFNVVFKSAANRINHIQVYSGAFPSVQRNIITYIGVYTDSTKSLQLYSNSNLIFREYNGLSMVDLDILPILGYTSVYIEIGKVTQGVPIINEIKFYNIGRIDKTSSGYNSGNTITMTRDNISEATRSLINPYGGGGGTNSVGGYGGPRAYNGGKFIGGSPAILKNQINISRTIDAQGSAGGGGGGYYGGGGGGAVDVDRLIGAGGGGGSGYIYRSNTGNSIFTDYTYSVAVPGINTSITNYISPSIDEQDILINNNIIQEQTVPYGQGGNPLIDSGQGGHGLIVIKYELNAVIRPPIMEDVFPSFIDGSKLIVYQAPIEYNTELRSLHFSTFQDPLQTYYDISSKSFPYTGYNWVWYKSFLSLIGLSLTDLLKPSGPVPINPTTLVGTSKVWSYLPDSIYTSLSGLLTKVTDFYTTVKDDTKITSITSEINLIFIRFQLIFIQLSSTSNSYTEMTEIYCLLDYLRNPSNLAKPHAATGALDRLLGGIPKFGYWANPFFTNASYIGFDINNGHVPIKSLSSIVKSSEPVQAIYGLILEQHLSSGKYEFKDVMAYKPTSLDSLTWMIATQFSESYAVRTLTNPTYLESNVPVQPYTFKNAISARLPLFSYSVYTAPTIVNSKVYNAPIQVLNDFEGSNIYMYSFQNSLPENISSINISQLPFTSTVLQMNQLNIHQQGAVKPPIIGTIVSEYQSTVVNAITGFGFNGINYRPLIKYTTGTNNYYNNMSPIALDTISNSIVGKAINDLYGNYYFTKNDGSTNLYQNICTNKLYPSRFNKEPLEFASAKYILGKYNSEPDVPYSDFFFSKYTNLWHIPAKGLLDTIYGVRLNSPYDFSIKTNFANQIFYPVHKITLVKTGSLVNPILDTTDTMTYPSFQRTQMFFYKNYSKMISDISGQYAMEKTSNFAYSDMLSGYGFNSYIYNINMPVSTDFNNENADSFNYLAIRAYSPSETFQSLVRFYLPQRYDFGYISLKDLSNEKLIVTTTPNVNPDYKRFLTIFNGTFSTNQNYGSTGVPGFSGSNISTVSFGDFLNQYNNINLANIKNTSILSTVSGLSNAAITNLITGDLRKILPSSIANRNRTTDPIEFSIPFSTCATPSNAKIEQYGMGYNLGFAFKDTNYNTVHRATSFFKLLDDSIYLRMNEEFGLNKMDISQPENFAETLETTAQSGRYNSKLILNSFGSFATTFVQSPVTFNPTLGKLDKLSFSWYNSAGVLLNNNDCDWSGSVQIVESVTASAT